MYKRQDYEQPQIILEHLTLTFHDAGHILGSSIVELQIRDDADEKTLVFSGDLGNPDASLMRPLSYVDNADVVLMESTYGDRDHRCFSDTLDEFRVILKQAELDGGNILIPAFAVGRTQELLFHLGQLYHEGLLEHWHVFLDSPMGKAVTDVYSHYIQQLDNDDVALIRAQMATATTALAVSCCCSSNIGFGTSLGNVPSGS